LVLPVLARGYLSDQIHSARQIVGRTLPRDDVDTIVLDHFGSGWSWPLAWSPVAKERIHPMQCLEEGCSVRSWKTKRHRRSFDVSARRDRGACLEQIASLVGDLWGELLGYYGAVERMRQKEAEQVY